MKKIMSGIICMMMAVVASAETYEGLVVNKGGSYVLTKPEAISATVINIAWAVRNAMVAYEGKIVRVTGTPKPDAAYPTLITVDSVEVIGE